MFGVNKDIGRNWALSAFLGLNGTRTQLTAIFGYRWQVWYHAIFPVGFNAGGAVELTLRRFQMFLNYAEP